MNVDGRVGIVALSNRLPALVLAIVAVALTLTGVVLAATDANPGGQAKDTLTLNGYPPRTATLLVDVSTGQNYSLSATVALDFTTDNAQATVNFPLIFSVSSVGLRLVDGHLYAGPAAATSGPYFSVPLKQPGLFGLSLEMTKPDIALISGFTHRSVTHHGYVTSYDFQRSNVAVTHGLGPASQASNLGSLDWRIDVGSQGQVIGSTMRISSAGSTTTISVTVLSYNKHLSISAPPLSQVKPMSSSVLRQLLNLAPLRTLLLPQNFTSLGQLHLN